MSWDDDIRLIAAEIKRTAPKQPETHAAKVVRVADGTVWVHVFGGAEETPASTVLSSVKPGDMVQATISKGRLTIAGNSSDPAASSSSVVNAVEKVDLVSARQATFERVTTQTLLADEAAINDLQVGKLDVDSAIITNLEAQAAKITNLTAQELAAATAYIAALVAGNVTAQNVIADHGDFGTVKANAMKVANLTAAQLEADHATVGSLSSNYAHITNGVIDTATIGHAQVTGLEANYAKLDATNIDAATIRNAWVDALMVQSGLIAHEGTVYSLDAIQVNAASITAGTIDVDRLIVTVDGEKYLVHVVSGTPTYEKLDGGVIEDLTITTDKLVAGAVTAQKITTENLVGSGGWINLRNGTFEYESATTGEGIAWDGSHLYISGNVTMGTTTLDKIKGATDEVTYDNSFTRSGSVYTFTARATRAGEDVTSLIDPDMFSWRLRTESGETSLGRGVTCTVDAANVGYRSTVIGDLDEVLTALLVDDEGNHMTMSDGSYVLIEAVWEV